MKFLATILFVILLTACNNKNRGEYSEIAENVIYSEATFNQEHPGKRLMENNCNICHNPKTAEESIIAPPMIAVKMHYTSEETTKEDFVNAMVEWAKNPSVETAKMPGAVKKFGLMPYQFYPEKTIKQIADYIFESEIDEPVWFEEHYKKMHGDRPKMKGKMQKRKGMGKRQNKNTEELSTKDRGMEIAQATKAELGKNLMGQIQENGVIAALDFCNLEAMPITNNMATVHNANIKRITDKPRNPNNKANTQELKYIESFKKQVATGNEVKPIVVEKWNGTEFYYPIITDSMCLKCHGTPGKELKTLTLSKIKDLYPADIAVGYGENEVRGMWSIEFSR